jgi:hypothetical protein
MIQRENKIYGSCVDEKEVCDNKEKKRAKSEKRTY